MQQRPRVSTKSPNTPPPTSGTAVSWVSSDIDFIAICCILSWLAHWLPTLAEAGVDTALHNEQLSRTSNMNPNVSSKSDYLVCLVRFRRAHHWIDVWQWHPWCSDRCTVESSELLARLLRCVLVSWETGEVISVGFDSVPANSIVMSIADNNPVGQDVKEHALDVWHRLGRLADGFQH